MFIDTHCHIHESEYADPIGAKNRAIESNVTKMLCIGVSEDSSRRAVEFATRWPVAYAVVGVHPHEAKSGYGYIEKILQDAHKKVVGLGEIGLDYFYDNSPREAQIVALEQQLQWAREYGLPVSFHVRDSPKQTVSVWDDFWPIFDNFSNIKGVLHSFTDTTQTLEQAVSRGLYIGVNGISTFAKDKQVMWDAIPLEKMLLETDAPFLTPVPYRGRVNEPAFVRNVAEYHAKRRAVELEHLARVTSANATQLFSL